MRGRAYRPLETSRDFILAAGGEDAALEKRTQYELIARFNDILDISFESRRYRPPRRASWAGLKGRVLDAGVGTGRNPLFYPMAAQVSSIDLS